jgi:NADP-dependent 3-hydroxy acid dehydrogenase YdfG
MSTRHGRVVAITGASAGVGRALAREFARQGASIGLIARGLDGLEAARHDVEQLGGRALVLPADVADADAIETAAQQLEDAFGPIDVWINNAMTAVFARVHETTAQEFRRVTEVSYLGFVHGTLSALARMRPRNRGVIVQVGSALAHRGIPLQATYCGAKHAIDGFSDALRCELLHEKSRIKLVRVNLPAMNTPQFDWVRSRLPFKARPVAPVYQPEVAARAIAWVVDHPRRELWVGWPTVATILGNRLAPALLDRYLARVAISGQQSGEPEEAGRADNVDAPLAGDHGVHGRFGDEAKPTSAQTWAALHKAWWFSAVALLAAAALVGRSQLGRRGARTLAARWQR